MRGFSSFDVVEVQERDPSSSIEKVVRIPAHISKGCLAFIRVDFIPLVSTQHYRVTQKVSDFGWVDLILGVPLAGGLLL